MESTDTQRLGKSSPNGKCGTNRNTFRLSSPRPPHGEWIFFRAHDPPAHATIPPTCRSHRMRSTRPPRSYASNQNATSLPCPKEVRYRKTAGPGSLQQEIPDKCPEFLRSYNVSSKPSPDESQVASRKQAPGRYPFASICRVRPVSSSRRAGAGHPRPTPFRSQRQKYMPRRSRISASCWMALKAPCCAACSAAACARTRSASGVCFSSTAMSSTSNR